jgi:hypothetical protein
MKRRSELDLQGREVPASLAKLPRFAITPSRASTREQGARSDVAFGVRSIDDLLDRVGRGFADPNPPLSPTRGKVARK